MNDKFLMDALEYDSWATAKVLERCASLSDEELAKDTGIGRGKIGATLEHLIGSGGFAKIIAGETLTPPGPRPETFARPEALLDAHKANHGRLTEVVAKASAEGKLEEKITVPWSGASVTKLAFIGLYLEHATFHRSEVEIMLGVLGLPAFPGVSVVNWAVER